MKRTSYTKKTLKFFKLFFITLFAFILFLFLIGKLAEKKITALAFNQLKESIEVPIETSDISFTLIKRFPLATIEFENIWIGSPDKTGSPDSVRLNCDTLINIEKLYISVKSTPLIDGIFDIQKIEILGANIDYTIDKNGISNFDFLIDITNNEKPDTTLSTPLDLTLNELLLMDITCYYSDSLTSTKAKIDIPEINLKGKIKKDIYSGFMDGSMIISECDFKETHLDRMLETKMNFEIGFENDSVKIRNLSVLTDGAILVASGVTVITDSIYVDLNIKGDNINLAELMKYVPEDTLRNYDIKSLSGLVTFDATIKGIVSDSTHQPKLDLNLTMQEGEVQTTEYPELKNISFNLNATNGNGQNEETTEIDIERFHFETENSKGDINLSFENLNHPEYDIKSDLNLNISDFRLLIPDSLIQDISGNIKAQLTTRGVLPDSINSDFFEYLLQTTRAKVTLSDFNVTMDSLPPVKSFSGTFNYHPGQLNASMLNVSIPDYHVNIKNSSFNTLLSGKLTRPEATVIDIKSFIFNTDSSCFTGSAFIQNLKTPSYKLNIEIKLNLSEIRNMLPDSLVNELSGEVTSTITSIGEINPDSISEQINDIIFKKSSFIINLNNVSVKMPDTLMCINNLTGSVKIIPDTIHVEKLDGGYKNIDFDVSSVKIVNLYNSYIKNLHEQLYVEGAFHLGDIDYDIFAPFMDSTSMVTSTDTTLAISSSSLTSDAIPLTTDTSAINYTFLIKGKLTVNSFAYNKALIKNISALFNLKDSLYTIDQLTFDGFKGKMVSSMKYNIVSEDKQIITFRNRIEGMDISQLLTDFDNFDQEKIISKQVSGLLSTDIDGWLLYLGDTIVTDSIYLKGDLKLENGGLFNYKPAMELANFTNIKELDNMRFKTMESKIFIFNNSMYVPSTGIKSNAMNITAYGMQSFGEDYEYHLKIYLGEILRGTTKHIMKKQAELENNPESNKKGPRSLYVVSYSLNGKMKNGLDNKKMRQKMNTKIKLQQMVLDIVFHPKLVNFETEVPDYLN